MVHGRMSKGKPMVYQIRIKGELDGAWSNWFDGLDIQIENQVQSVTVLSGEIVDQAKLRSLLNKIFDLNLTLLSVNIFEGSDDFNRPS